MIKRPMKPYTYEEGLLDGRFPLFLQEKLDGLRCIVDENGIPHSASMKRFENEHLNEAFKAWKDCMAGLDGELLVCDESGRTCHSTSSWANSFDHEVSNWIYVVYDIWTMGDKPYGERLNYLRTNRAAFLPDNVSIIATHAAAGMSDVERFRDVVFDAGREGIIIRDPKGLYKEGRSGKRGPILRIKKVDDMEARIVGYTELMRNENAPEKNELGLTKRSSAKAGKRPAGVLGAVIVEGELNGKKFTCKIGTGYTEEQRKELWAVRDSLAGRLAKFSYEPSGMKDKPRNPSFIALREESDL